MLLGGLVVARPGAVLDLTFDLGGRRTPTSESRSRVRRALHARRARPWTLSLAPYQGAGPRVSFQLGAGEPMPASSQGQMVQASRLVVTAGRAAVAGA